LANQLEESKASFCHNLFAKAGKIFYNDGDDFALHDRVAFEDINRVDKYVTLLHWVFLSQQHLDALLFTEVLCDAQALDFFGGLYNRGCDNLTSVSEVRRIAGRARRTFRSNLQIKVG